MNETLFILYLLTAMFALPLLVSIWIFGLRRYIYKKGKTTITACSWGLSMWADWTVAWEIGKAEGKQPLSVKAFFAFHVFVIIEVIAAFIL